MSRAELSTQSSNATVTFTCGGGEIGGGGVGGGATTSVTTGQGHPPQSVAVVPSLPSEAPLLVLVLFVTLLTVLTSAIRFE